MNKKNIVITVLVQVFFFISIIKDMLKGGNIEKVQNSIESIIGLIIFLIIYMVIYIYIARKFWRMKKYLVYKIFSILNILYVCHMLLNGVINILNLDRGYAVDHLVIIMGICIFLIGNIILILTYNRNLRKLENK